MEEEFKRLEDGGDESWKEHFEMIFAKSRHFSSDVGDEATNKQLNRYLDVKPYDRSRVKLERINKTNDYINANLVTVPKAARQYILTQGPLPETLSHFWLMVWEQKSNVIVMLNRIYEMEEFKKCEQYWPANKMDKLHYDDVDLTVAAKSFRETKHYCVREMTLTDNKTNTSRTITQFHYTAWPDHGQPDSPTSFLRLLSAIRKSGGLDKMDEPTVVHCSAGIGRSGTFCLIDSILTMVENQGSTEGIDIVNNLIEMRDYRKGLIQTPIQLRFSYMTIIYGIKILEKANKLNPHISSTRALDGQQASQQAQKSNGSVQAATNGKKARRNRKKQTNSNNLNSLNVFKKHLLVDALEDIDSDSADDLFYETMKPLPNMKKPRNSLPEDFIGSISSLTETILLGASNGQSSTTVSQHLKQQGDETNVATRAQMLTNAINSLLTEKTISKNNDASSTTTTLLSNAPVSETADSSLLRRRERELKNLELKEKVENIKHRMKAEELKKERYIKRMALFKKTALYGGVAALALSSVLYIYLNGHSSS